jgi:hypothetical protein
MAISFAAFSSDELQLGDVCDYQKGYRGFNSAATVSIPALTDKTASKAHTDLG